MSQIQIDGFTDIHTHILPGVDDGSQSLATSLEMIRMARDNGTRRILLTPHYRGEYRKNTPEHLREVYAQLCSACASQFPEMDLYLGNEIFYEPSVPERLESGRILTMGDSKYALIEFMSVTPCSQMIRAVSEVTCAGFIPVVAHIERYNNARSHPELADELLDMGAIIQMNADSIMGKHGFQVRRYCHKMLKAGKVHVIGSDCHNTDHRTPLLRDCFLRVHRKYGAEYAADLFCCNGRAIVENREIEE